MRSRALSQLLLLFSFTWVTTYAAEITAPTLSARAYVLTDARSGTELAAYNADIPLPPASLTKLMTAYVLFGDLRSGHLKPDELVTVSRYACSCAKAIECRRKNYLKACWCNPAMTPPLR